MGIRQRTMEGLVNRFQRQSKKTRKLDAMNVNFWNGKNVFLTGHTGFKGTWMSRVLIDAGAVLTGYSLSPPTQPNLFEISGVSKEMRSVIGDIRNFEFLQETFAAATPEIVIHMAAQPIVRDSYQMPRYTYETNVMGTVNILECVRESKTVRSFLNVTTDKVYENKERALGYVEDEPLDGFDPYSNSKSCSELVTHSYKNAFFSDGCCAISTARAGNVIGGGDFAHDRIIPDCVRAAIDHETVIVRNPNSTRPYQHVLESIVAYLMIAQRQLEEPQLASWYNVGPDDCDCATTGELVKHFCNHWGNGLTWESRTTPGPHESNFLRLNCVKLKQAMDWQPHWHIDTAVEKTVQWSRVWLAGEDTTACMRAQIKEYLED